MNKPAGSARAIAAFVDEIETGREADMSFRSGAGVPLPICSAGAGLSRYLLLAAAIDAQTDSTAIRPFLARLDGQARAVGLERGLFALSAADGELVRSALDESPKLRGWRLRTEIARIIAEANAFVDGPAGGDFDAWARRFTGPGAIVDTLARGIYYQGRSPGEARKKLWMLMRWLVRPAPDLRLWNHLDPAQLLVPVDAHVARFALEFGLLDHIPAIGPRRAEAERITAFARQLFPLDPARVDYPFFMWSRARHQRPGPDTCAAFFRTRGCRCPLHSINPCCARCP
jgi:hypothetical protein